MAATNKTVGGGTARPVRRPPNLATRIEAKEAVLVADNAESPEALELGPRVGPLGNPDYIEFGSPAHDALLGFDPQTGETTFDVASASTEQLTKFVDQRKRYLAAGVPPVGPEVPPMWNPDAEPDIHE